MPDNNSKASSSCSSLTAAQGDSTIAFAYIKVLSSRKRRFFVLKSVPKASPWELEGLKPPMDYHLYMYKNEKSYQKNEFKRVYNLGSVILLSRCTKKDNNTVLGICFQDDALFLKFSSEDELNRWYFHFSEIYNVKRNCHWPELQHCYSVTLKPKDLASPTARHGKPDLAGQYRFCLTDSAVLLVRDNLLKPTLCLPFRSIRSLAHSVSASFFQIHLGRLSPIGEGVLHFEVEQSCMLKEVTETLMRCLSDAGTRGSADGGCGGSVKSSGGGGAVSGRSGRRASRDSVMRTTSFQTVLQRGGSVRHVKQCEDKSMSTFSERVTSATYSSLSDAQRTQSQPLSDSFDDYCDLNCGGTQPTADASGVSLNSSTSLSVNSELAGMDYMPCTVGSAPAHQRPRCDDPGSSSAGRISSWRFDSLDSANAAAAAASAAAAVSAAASAATGGSSAGSPALGSRANSVGCRPPSSLSSRLGSYQLPSSYSVPSAYMGEPSHTGGHRDDRQVFVEVNFVRPRTTSEASRYRSMIGGFGGGVGCGGGGCGFGASGSRFRPRTGSYGNRSGGGGGGRSCQSQDDGRAPDLTTSGSVPAPPGCGGELALQSVREAACPKEDDAYMAMSFAPSGSGVAAGASGCQRRVTDGGDSPKEEEEEEEEDPYWVCPSQLDRMIGPVCSTSLSQNQCQLVEH